MVSLREVFEVRLTDFENEFCWNEEQDCLLRGFLATGEWVALTLGEDAAVDVMGAIAKSLLSPQAASSFSPVDWRESWIAAEELRGWPSFMEDLRDLRAFAEAGIFRPARFAERAELTSDEHAQLEQLASVPDFVRQCAAVVEEFMRLAPQPAGYGAALYDALERTKAKALARLNLDEGGSLTLQELADLSGLSLKRVQNAAYEKGGNGPLLNKHGRVEREGAVSWLTQRGFKFSIWPQMAQLAPLGPDWGRSEPVDPALIVNDDLEADLEVTEGDYVFVPVAADRTKFLPSLRRENGYQIGAKGSEVWEQDYFKALDALSKQATPRWRRPNDAQNWGIVSGVAWDRVPRSELERALREAQ